MVMLIPLHEELAKIAPISVVSENKDGDIEVSYLNEPTAEERSTVDLIIKGWPLEKSKLEAGEEIDEAVKQVEETGFDTGKGYRIDLSTKGSSDLTGSVVLAKETVSRDYDGLHFILDSQGITQSVSYEELIEISIEYGKARNALYILASQKALMIRKAGTIEEVRKIKFSS